MYLYNRIKHYSIPDPSQRFTGITAKIILIHTKLSPEETAFLNKMVIAYKWQIEELLQIEIQPDLVESYTSLWRNKQIKLVWLFDTMAESVGIFVQLPKYQIFRFTHFDIYYTDTLAKIELNKPFKSKVWQDLKDIKLD